MKRFNLSKLVGAGIIAASLATLPAISVSAQTNTAPSTTDTTTTTTESEVYNNAESDRDFDWGWLGLLGLLGLAGLAKRSEPVRYREDVDREADSVSRSGYPR